MGREIFFCLLSKNLCSLVLVFIFVNTTSFSFGNVCCNIPILVLDHYHGTLVRYVILDSSFCMNSKKLYFPYSIIILFLLLLLKKTIFCISDQTKYNPREAIFEKCYNLVCSYIFIFCYMVIVLYVILYSQITLFFCSKNLRKGDTRLHYIGFYAIYYIENIAFAIIYAIHSAENNFVFKYSLVLFVCCGFWLAVCFQLIYYRFLHPNTHVRLSTKESLSTFIHCRRSKKSRSCEDVFRPNDSLTYADKIDLIERTSLQLDTTIVEQRHNRFAKENRQKLILQQQVIDQKVKLTRLEKANQHSNRFLTKISASLKRPTMFTTTLVETEQQQQQQPQPHENTTLSI